MNNFAIRLNCVDHYQSRPTDLDPQLFGSDGSTQRNNAPTIPVIRVFGATNTGQKVCAHVHGALPYLYIEYRGSLEKDAVRNYIRQLRSSIDHALAVSYKRNLYDGNALFVAHITLVKGVPFFGYHVGYRFFLKIYLLNPMNMTRLSDLLHQGAILSQKFQPFEAHLQYLAQWMCDFNLYGCANIVCDKVRFREPLPKFLDNDGDGHQWHDRSVSPDAVLDPALFPRQSHCSIEVDLCVHNILNRKELKPRDIHADFIERFNPPAPDEKLVNSLAGLWKDETRRRKLRLGMTDLSSSPFPPEVLVSMSADPRSTHEGGWIHEEEFRRLVTELVANEAEEMPEIKSFQTFGAENRQHDTVQTAIESVEDLFPDKLRENADIAIPNLTEDLKGKLEDTRRTVADEVDLGTGLGLLSDSNEENEEELVALGHRRPQDISQMTNIDIAPTVSPGDGSNPLTNSSIEHRLPEPQEMGNYSRTTIPEIVGGCVRSPGHEVEDIYEKSIRKTPKDMTTLFDIVETSGLVKRRKTHTSGTYAPSTASAGVKNDLIPEMRLSKSDSTAKNFKQTLAIEQSSALSDGTNAWTRQGLMTSITTESAPSKTVRTSHTSTPGAVPFAKGSRQEGNLHLREFGMPDTLALGGHHSSSDAPEMEAEVLTTSLKSNPSEAAERSGTAITRLTVQPTLSVGAEYGKTTPKHPRMLFPMATLPPIARELTRKMASLQLPHVVYQEAYYGDERDVPERPRDYAGREFKLEGTTIPFLPEFDLTAASPASLGPKAPAISQYWKQSCRLRNWDIAILPPSRNTVITWAKVAVQPLPADFLLGQTTVSGEGSTKFRKERDLSQIDGPTQKSRHGFKFSQKRRSTSVRHETQYMTTLSLEVHVNTRENLAPDPDHDQIGCVFWCLRSDDHGFDKHGHSRTTRMGIIVLAEDLVMTRKIEQETKVDVCGENNELDLINKLVDIVRDIDPDILTGYEVHNGSWGYLIERARIKYEYNLCDELSRMRSQSHGRFGKDADRWGFNHTSTIRITGRHMINIWRAMRGELNLLQYTMENVVFHLLHKRIPHYKFRDLTNWYNSRAPKDFGRCLQYYMSRVQLDLDILEANELIPRTSEQARLIGVDFFAVFSRGSQFKVESFMFRIAKPENFILVSPSRKQVGQQNALECLPLVMEPQSEFYSSPLLVLDFQALYPSIMIAYNYCYSTCLGRIVSWRGKNKLGFSEFNREPGLLGLVKDSINIAPNGMMFVKPEMRKSLLAKMLSEILETRVMVKSGMKADKDDKTLQQLLNNRQLALKLLANVTYGYTSASFSGRMPCAEIADSIVQTARETLEKAIAFIHSIDRWGAEVVYGDTDSLFVYLKGRRRDQAFQIGNEIAEAVTKMNPRPVKLKFEKVYHPCVLLAKKRYVGFKYESPTQLEPEFDAKGIETVRRDGTPAEQMIEEKALKVLFRTADLSQVKAYFQRQCAKIMTGKVSVQDFCFAREVKLGTYADKGPPPPGALISTRRMLADPRLEPQYGERVPYVVIAGPPRARLIDRCVAPEVLLEDESAELDADYYISKNLIPPLERIFNLVGANVRQWYDEMPKVQRVRDLYQSIGDGEGESSARHANPSRRTLESYLKSSHCVVCHVKLKDRRLPAQDGDEAKLPICQDCHDLHSASLSSLRSRIRNAQAKANNLEMVCRSCEGLSCEEEVKCDSKDCPVFYSRVDAWTKLSTRHRLTEYVAEQLEDRKVDDM